MKKTPKSTCKSFNLSFKKIIFERHTDDVTRPTTEERPVYRHTYGTAWHDGIRNLFLHETDFSTSERIETTS